MLLVVVVPIKPLPQILNFENRNGISFILSVRTKIRGIEKYDFSRPLIKLSSLVELIRSRYLGV